MRAVSSQTFVFLGFLLGLTALAGAVDQTVDWKVRYMDSVNIVVGDTVSYVWGDTAPHDVRATGSTNTNSIVGFTGTGVDTVTARAPFTLRLQFTAPGTYTFDCSVHPATMKSTVNVAASAAPVANATTPTSTAPITAVTSAPTATTSAPAATPAVTGGLSAVTAAPTTTSATTTATPVPTTPPSGAASLRNVAVSGLLLLSIPSALLF